jgi:tRNA pseudouridine55 synthase
VGRLASDGLVVVDKPAAMTSHDVVARVRRLARTRRVGHAGTLDPMATGVLIVGVERATRLLTYLVGTDKVYRATVRLGQSTVTDDAEGEVTGATAADGLTDELVRKKLAGFLGEQDQVPSAVSAIKLNGVRAYARVRKGEEVTLAARRITISRLEVSRLARETAADGTPVLDVDVEVGCSSGTYIRAIARDLGAELGVGGHLTALRRTAVGSFSLAQASTLDSLAEMDDPVAVPLTEAAANIFTRRDADADEARVLAHGGPLRAIGITGPYAVFAPDGDLIGIVAENEGRARAQVVFAPANASPHSEGS